MCSLECLSKNTSVQKTSMCVFIPSNTFSLIILSALSVCNKNITIYLDNWHLSHHMKAADSNCTYGLELYCAMTVNCLYPSNMWTWYYGVFGTTFWRFPLYVPPMFAWYCSKPIIMSSCDGNRLIRPQYNHMSCIWGHLIGTVAIWQAINTPNQDVCWKLRYNVKH